jgi:DNA-binding MarR family transcriptional regulator
VTDTSISVDELDLTLLSLFAGWAWAEETQRRLADAGFADLRFGDGVIFQHLVDNDVTVTDLAERMQVSQQAASKAVADLRDRGWVQQRVDPQDARARRIGLTERGRAAIEAGRRIRSDLVAETAALHAAPDLQATRRVLAGVIARHGSDSAVRGRRVLPPR